MKLKYKGENLTKEELKEISENFSISKHAQQRINERFPNLNIKEAILNPILAYFNTDGSMNIALNKFEYFVIVKNKDGFLIVTFKEKSHNNITIFKKRKLAELGYARKTV